MTKRRGDGRNGRRSGDPLAGAKISKSKSERKVTSVYVTGLPLDASLEDMAEYFKKCGILYEDPKTGKSH
jgi:RNA recognition motif-containing protein